MNLSINQDNIKYEIKKIKTYEDYVFIYLDDQKIQISIDDYFKYNVSKLKGLNEDIYNVLVENEKQLKAYRSCLRKLAIKDYTCKQIRTHLKRYEIDDKKINEIINKLVNYGLLNDEKYCVSKINVLNNQSLSNKQIKRKLINEGIEEEYINKHLKEDLSYEMDKCDKLAVKYERSINKKSSNAKKHSIISKLVNNGFSYDVALSSVNKLSINVDNELELLHKEYLKAKNKFSRKYEDYELRNKIYNALISKGFKSDDIKKVMEV